MMCKANCAAYVSINMPQAAKADGVAWLVCKQ
jgi:hypothetical protein